MKTAAKTKTGWELNKLMPMGSKSLTKSFYDKKVIPSKKYDHIGPSFKTGVTVKDVQILSDKVVSKRKSELFKRIKCSTLSNLLLQERSFESIYKLKNEEEDNILFTKKPLNKDEDAKSLLSMAQSEVSRVSAVTYATENLNISDNTSFLLLDIRQKDSYDQYHIKEAVSFPGFNFNRDRALPEIIRFKNKPDKIIIIYGSDEKEGIPVATNLYEKGFNNVFLISGGVEKFALEFPDLVEGMIPKTLCKPLVQKFAVRRDSEKENSVKLNFTKKK